jgi:PmbA protein
MRDEKYLRALAHKVLGLSTAQQTEVLIYGTDSALTRFANNHIHQNVTETNISVSVRAVIDKKIGVAQTNKLDDASLQRVVESATAIASVQHEDPDFHSLPEPAPITPVHGFSEDTAAVTPDQRAAGVKVVIDLARERGLEAAGAFETNVHHIAIANSLGIFAYQPRTEAEFHAVVMAGDNGSGWTQRLSMDASIFDFEAMAREAVEKAERSRNPTDLLVGEYPVVLDTYAVGEMLEILAFMGVGANAVEEQRSWLSAYLGQKVAAEVVTIYDDATDPLGLPSAFDYEGVPKQRVAIIDHGIAKGPVYDSYTAYKEGKPNTGHALPAPNTMGPYPEHLMMAPGTASREDLFKGIERGVYVTRFHYTNIVHPVQTLFTGMTRDGTFLIEHGEITRPVKSFRFTQSILDVLAGVEALGRERLQSRDYVNVVAPALRAARFNFIGTTQ